MKKLYAFWDYSSFPYILGAPISDINEKGSVYVDSYMSWFRPRKIVPLSTGLKLKQKLDKIEKEYRDEKKVLDEEFQNLLKEILD